MKKQLDDNLHLLKERPQSFAFSDWIGMNNLQYSRHVEGRNER